MRNFTNEGYFLSQNLANILVNEFSIFFGVSIQKLREWCNQGSFSSWAHYWTLLSARPTVLLKREVIWKSLGVKYSYFFFLNNCKSVMTTSVTLCLVLFCSYCLTFSFHDRNPGGWEKKRKAWTKRNGLCIFILWNNRFSVREFSQKRRHTWLAWTLIEHCTIIIRVGTQWGLGDWSLIKVT